ncbi:MAG TPA: hypothetical protein VG826_30975 [Pirellulales bacterium]|nr:hypothetical protein [Pirellulales bacterium]
MRSQWLIFLTMSDKEVGDFTDLLQAFPQLTTLQFKSSKITDLGVLRLKALPQLRVLALENAEISDAGLAPLRDLVYLAKLNLKGTKVSDTGVQEIQRALPALKVER